ncbi:hypothetical protein BH24CHL4_BH24CHL4_26450 [soil metagenome]
MTEPEPGQVGPALLPAASSPIVRGFFRRVVESSALRARINRFVTIAWLTCVAILAAWVIFKGREDLRNTVREIRDADPVWIAAAVLIQFIVLVFCAVTYMVVLRRLGHRPGFWRLFDAHMQRSSISVVTPAGGPASIFVFVRYVGQRGVPAEDGLLTIGVRTASSTITFIAVLVPAALIGSSLAGGLIALLLLAGMVIGGIALVKGERDEWQTPLRWSRRLPRWARTRVQGFIINFRDHGLRPIDLVPPMLLALLVRVGVIGVLWASLNALGISPSMETMFRTYFASLLASTIIPVFAGAGAVEAVSIVALRQAGIPNEIAIGAVLLWRLIDLWIPVGIGVLLHARQELPGLVIDHPQEANSGGRIDSTAQPGHNQKESS